MSKERRHYIDNLRSMAILFLFPVHTFMIWNDFGSGFYIWLGESRILSTCIVLINPWFMPLLFVLAGISARYALEKRSTGEFIRQRIEKLLVPFLAGMVFLVPFQTWYARKFFYGYEGSLWENLCYFFTHLTDFSGYDGAFTPGHLWFILFLFIISMMALAVWHIFPYEKAGKYVERLSGYGVLFLFIPVWLMYYIGNFGGYSIGKNLALYLIGYYVLSSDNIMEKLEKCKKLLNILFVVMTAASVTMYYTASYYGDLWVNAVGWISILFLLVSGKNHWNKRTAFTAYFNRASYPIYILHQSILVVLAYYVAQISKNFFVQVTGILLGSFLLTVAAYHLIRRIPFVRRIIGLK